MVRPKPSISSLLLFQRWDLEYTEETIIKLIFVYYKMVTGTNK